MSKIEVDAITEQSGSTLTTGGGAGKTVVVDATTVTLGRCGGTVALASGASQTGFGRTGTVDWDTTPKTATFSAVSGNGYFCNTSNGAFTVNLPAGSAGAIVSLADYAATWQTSNLTVSPNGTEKIGGVNSDVTLDTEGQSVTFVYVDSTQGWVNTMDSTSNVRGSTFICASVSGAGNTLVTSPDCADVKIATFTGPGDFTVNTISSSPTNNVVSYLVVAGGGGTNPNQAGGGGAGGFREGKSPVTPYTASPLNAPTGLTISSTGAIPVQIGGGGAAQATGTSGDGSNTVFSTITSTGGGTGLYRSTGLTSPSGGSGGGGGGNGPQNGGAGNTPPVSPPQGNAGGNGLQNDGGGGGGGGAGAVGVNSSAPRAAGNGGAGVSSSITASSVAYAGGGGGGSGTGAAYNCQGAGGIGGGGTGGSGNATPTVATTAGADNTGGGGGGGGNSGGTQTAQTGGSGIVVIRYKFQ